MKYALIALLIIVSPALAEEFTFKNRGKLVGKFTLEELKKKVDAKTIPIWEPHELVEKKYTGIPFTALLTAVYGDRWKQAEELLFTCRDGYQPSVPMPRFQKHASYLTFEIPGAEFKVNNKFQNEKNVELSPFYLVWDNVTEPALKEEGATHWPYQVTTVDLIQFKDRFPLSGPPAKSTPAVVAGYLTYRTKCMSCHAVNGEGGPKAVELNYPSSVTEYFKEGWLEKWILSPRQVRFNTTMPALEGKFAKKEARDIIAYLKVMAKNKHEPAAKHED